MSHFPCSKCVTKTPVGDEPTEQHFLREATIDEVYDMALKSFGKEVAEACREHSIKARWYKCPKCGTETLRTVKSFDPRGLIAAVHSGGVKTQGNWDKEADSWKGCNTEPDV